MNVPVREHRIIEITKGKTVIVDADVYDEISKHRWSATRTKQAIPRWYAVRVARVEGKCRMVYMHRQILGLEHGDKRQADHVNRDNTLDNRRCNLRVCTAGQNKMNTSRRGGSPFRGIRWDRTRSKWISSISLNGKHAFIGRFDDPVEAAKAYDVAAFHRDSEFATFNFPEGDHLAKLFLP